MPDVVHLLLIAAAALMASTLAAVSGFGGAAVLLPVLVASFGLREAIPILTVAQLIGNGSRVWFNRHELNWRVVGWFALGGVPTASDRRGDLRPRAAAIPDPAARSLPDPGRHLATRSAQGHGQTSGLELRHHRSGCKLPLGAARQRRTADGSLLPRLWSGQRPLTSAPKRSRRS